MESQNPIAASGGDASTLDRIEAFLDGQDGDDEQAVTTNQGADEQPDDKAKPDKPENGDPAKSDEPQFTTAQLAALLDLDEADIDLDDDGKPVFKTKIDGKDGAAKFAELRKTYQLSGHAENRVREAAEKEKAAERRLQEAEQVIQARLQETQQSLRNTAQLTAIAQQELNSEYQSINWAQLAQENPGQAFVLKQRFEERQQRINGIFQQIRERDAQANHQAEAMRQANAQKNEQQQRERLLRMVPEWNDPATFAKERTEILGWFEKSGLSPEDFDLNKASQVVALRRAWQQDTLQKSKPDVEKKLRVAPKLVKPGQAPQPNEGAAAKAKSLKASIKNASPSESTKAFADYLLATGQA